MRKRYVLGLLFVLLTASGWLSAAVPPGSEADRGLGLFTTLSCAALVLLWCVIDAGQRGMVIPMWMKLLVFLLAIVGLPLYLIRSRGRLRGGIAILKALLFLAVCLAASYVAGSVHALMIY